MTTRLLLTALFLSVSCFAGAAAIEGQSGTTLLGCLQEADGAPGYLITKGTSSGVAVTGPETLADHAGHWVKLTGESEKLEGKQHFRARFVQMVAATCDQPTVKTAMDDADSAMAVASLKDPQGKSVGWAELTQAPHGVLLRVRFEGLPPGRHAIHIHEKGACEAPEFKSAGGHFNPRDNSHGYLEGSGHHAGDMPNFEADAQGATIVEVLNPQISLKADDPGSLTSGEGTAIVVHDGTDDYSSQPSGDAGARIACGVIQGT